MELANQLLWITWEHHRRTREICRQLSLPLTEVTSANRGILKYPTLVGRTTRLLLTSKPRVLIVQCPSIVLGAWAAFLSRILPFRLVADLHNEAVTPFNYSAGFYRRLIAFIHSRAALSIVTNHGLTGVVKANGGRPFVLADPIPTVEGALGRHRGRTSVVFICTFAPDEPWREVIEAARSLPRTLTMFVTGRALDTSALDLPPNVRFTGFLSQGDYDDLLRSAAVVVDLTVMEDCLLCGAYEAVAVGAPLVTSDTAALRAHFSRGAVYTQNRPTAIAAAICNALDNSERLRAEMRELKVQLQHDWQSRATELRRFLLDMTTYV